MSPFFVVPAIVGGGSFQRMPKQFSENEKQVEEDLGIIHSAPL